MERKIDLKEFEDFMEEHGFESLGELKSTVSNIEKLMLIAAKTTNLEQENQALKHRWENLHEYIFSTKPLVGKSVCFLKETLLDKMQELELAELLKRKEK